MAKNGGGVILVGVDGSPASLEALTWAAEEAKIRRAELHVLRVWSLHLGGTSVGGTPAPSYAVQDSGKAAKAALEQSIRETLGKAPGLDVRASVAHGNPAKVLIDTASKERAKMLVVASRGMGGFKKLLLGSVSSQCVAHAACPVTVIHPRSG